MIASKSYAGASPSNTARSRAASSSTHSDSLYAGTTIEMVRTRSAHRLIEHVPALFQHLDAAVVLALDGAVVRALVDQPQQLEVHGVEQALVDGRLVEG